MHAKPDFAKSPTFMLLYLKVWKLQTFSVNCSSEFGVRSHKLEQGLEKKYGTLWGYVFCCVTRNWNSMSEHKKVKEEILPTNMTDFWKKKGTKSVITFAYAGERLPWARTAANPSSSRQRGRMPVKTTIKPNCFFQYQTMFKKRDGLFTRSSQSIYYLAVIYYNHIPFRRWSNGINTAVGGVSISALNEWKHRDRVDRFSTDDTKVWSTQDTRSNA